MCVLCVQAIASWQSAIEDPNTSEEWREELKNIVKIWESDIQDYKQQINHCETEIKQIEIENKGESII